MILIPPLLIRPIITEYGVACAIASLPMLTGHASLLLNNYNNIES